MDIVGLGLTTLDLLVRLRDMPTWERGGQMSAFRLDGGGPVGTALVAAARLGAQVGYVGTAGSDDAAELKLRSLRRDGVDLSHVAFRTGAENQVILVYVEEASGERVFAGLSTRREWPLQPEELDRDYITSARVLHLDGYHPEAALTAARWMRAAGKLVSLDAALTAGAVPAQLQALIRSVDVLICGAGLVPLLTGMPDVWEAGEAALALGPRIVVQTHGADGSYTVTRDERFHTPAFSVHVVDTTGAGDVFHGAYLVGLLKGWDLRRVARYASAVAAIKCTSLGGRAGIPAWQAVERFLREKGLDRPQGNPIEGA